MFVQLSIEINIIAIVILTFILRKVHALIDKQMNTLLFGRLLYCTLCISVLDVLELLLDGSEGTAGFGCHLLVTAVRMGFSGVVSALWFLYVLSENPKVRRWLFKGRRHQFLVLPVLVLAAASLASIWTGWVFTVDRETNLYQPGRWYVLQVAVTYGYFTSASLVALWRMVRRSVPGPRRLTGGMKVILPFIAGMTHLLFPQIAAVWVSLAVLLMMEYIDFLGEQISSDGLTKLNNRRSFDSYLGTALGERPGDVFLFMIDIDYFKHINDTYGHVEGDAALVTVSRTLKRVCAQKSAFLARYGGDEFAIVLLADADIAARQLKYEIKEAFIDLQQTTAEGVTYPIRISVGFARSSSASVTQLIKNADAALYLEKQRNHEQIQTVRSP